MEIIGNMKQQFINHYNLGGEGEGRGRERERKVELHTSMSQFHISGVLIHYQAMIGQRQLKIRCPEVK